MTTALERLKSKVAEDANGCWLWQASTIKAGYGRTCLDGRLWLAHRAMYTLVVGPIPDGLELDHLCKIKRCVNPAHLEPVTRSENIRRGSQWHHIVERAAAITHCPQDHPYSPENTDHTANGSRQCRKCKRAAGARYAARNRERIAAKSRAWRQRQREAS